MTRQLQATAAALVSPNGIDGRRAALLLGQVLFSEPDVEIRMSAIAGLSRVSGEAAWAFLETAAQDPHEQVRDYANAILMIRE